MEGGKASARRTHTHTKKKLSDGSCPQQQLARHIQNNNRGQIHILPQVEQTWKHWVKESRTMASAPFRTKGAMSRNPNVVVRLYLSSLSACSCPSISLANDREKR
jgi:hypothetical protein